MWALVGGITGLNALANPPAAMMTGFLALWSWWQSGWGWRGLRGAAVLVAAAAIVIAPAPLHNYSVCGEFTPLTGHAGLAFICGNTAGATGTYTEVPGISPTKKWQIRDSFRLYEQATGRPATWKAVNNFLFRKGLDYWRANPGPTVVLLGRKLYWFLTGRHFADIYSPDLEIEQGFADWYRILPVPVAWLAVPGLLAAGALAQASRHYGPELVLIGVPLLTVVVFFYSPRYRLPAVPILAAVCAWAVHRALQWRAHPRWTIGFGLVLGLGVASGPLNEVIGFDRFDSAARATFHGKLALALSRIGEIEQAAEQGLRAARLDWQYAPGVAACGNALREQGRVDVAVKYLELAQQIVPQDAVVNDQPRRALVAQNRLADALIYFRRAVKLAPQRADVHNDLAAALWQSNDQAGAHEHFLAALRIDPAQAGTHLALGRLLDEMGDRDGALEHLREAARLEPNSPNAHQALGQVLCGKGKYREGIAALRRANELAPDDLRTANDLAWYWATTPGLSADERASALLLAHQVAAALGQEPRVLDTLGAALAANGRFGDAVQALEHAVALAEQQGAAELVERYGARLALYRSGKPYIAPAEP